MNHIQEFYKKAESMKEFAKNYFDYVAGLLRSMDLDRVEEFVAELESAQKNRNTVFFAGNGGSAATAAHRVNDFGIDTTGAVAGGVPLRAISLTDNVPVLTAISNDRGYEKIFTDQLRPLYQKGDKLVVISASGNSPNVVAAAKWVKERGGGGDCTGGFRWRSVEGYCRYRASCQNSKRRIRTRGGCPHGP